MKRTLRRRAFIAIATVGLLVAGTFAGAAPANAATSARFYFKYQVIDGYSKSSMIRGSGSEGDTLKTGYTFYSYNNFKPKPTVKLQRKVGKKWVTLNTAKAKYGAKYSISVKLPKYTVPAGVPSQKVQYRFKAYKSSKKRVSNSDTSKAFTVTYENQAMYVGFALGMYNAMSAYCPAVAVHVDGSLAADEHAGLYQVFRGISVDPTVANYPYVDQVAVALHECAHYKQFYNFGGSATGRDVEERAAAKIFASDVNPAGPTAAPVGNFSPIEHAADCASHALNPDGYLGYGGYCNPYELAAGARLMQGARY